MSLRALGSGVREAGEYEEALKLARRGTELARKVQDSVLLAVNLDRLGEVQQALLNLEEARAAYEEALGRGYGAFFYARLSVVAALSENWEDANAHARRACEVGIFFNPFLSIHLHHEVEALLRGGDEEVAREEAHRLAERAEVNERERIAYLRSLAVLNEFEGDTQRAIKHLHKALTLAEKIGLPGEFWQIQSKIGELYKRRGEAEQAREAFSGAAQTLRMLAARIKDEGLREGFVAAPKVRRMLARE
jgi:tetratricopeptide (TPR) repeat protein